MEANGGFEEDREEEAGSVKVRAMDLVKLAEGGWRKREVPKFKVGDTVRVYIGVLEGDKVRSQAFEGVLIGRDGQGLRETFTVRSVSYGEGVVRKFLLHSPNVKGIEVLKSGKARRAKLYYLGKRVGKGQL